MEQHMMTAAEIQKLKEVELELLDELDRVCRENDLTYFLFGGTALGAIRHGGFIPWDDDIDVVMPRKDLIKLEKIANQVFDSKYHFQSDLTESEYPLMVSKLRKNGTIFQETATVNSGSHQGVFIDIFPLDKICVNDKDKVDRRIRKIKILTTAICENCGYNYGIKLHTKLLSKVLGLFGVQKLKQIRRQLMTKDNNSDTEMVTVIASNYGWKKQLTSSKVYFPPKEFTFEDKMYYGPNDIVQYLTNIYGDYMKLPPEEERITRHPILKIEFGEDNEKM